MTILKEESPQKTKVIELTNKHITEQFPSAPSDAKFAKELSRPLIENDLGSPISGQNIWSWRNGVFVPQARVFQLILKFELEDTWRYEFAKDMLKIIKGE